MGLYSFMVLPHRDIWGRMGIEMLARVVLLACLIVLPGIGAVMAQTDGPAELPKVDYPGQSYIDSAGCIFVKSGYGGTDSWVPRVGADRKPICGQTPTDPAVKAPKIAAKSATLARSTHAKKRRGQAPTKPAPVVIGCPVSVPIARRYATTDGGSVVLCTAKNGSLTGARSPIYPAGSGVGAALSKSRYPGVTIPLPNGPDTNPTVVANPKNTLPFANSPKAKADSYYVQVGAFAQPSNAAGASSRLVALGLPVSKGKFSRQGKTLQVIYAGPFATGADAQAALGLAQIDGFADAYIR